MAHAIVSTKYQVVIPRDVRREMGIKAGQIVQIIAKNGVITIVPDQPVKNLRGFLRGMKTRGLREKNRV